MNLWKLLNPGPCLWLLGLAFSASVLVLTGPVSAQQSDADLIEEWPLAFACKRDDRVLVAHLSEIRADGTAVYRGSFPGGVAVVSADGVIERVGGGEGGCSGLSISDLRSEGLVSEWK